MKEILSDQVIQYIILFLHVKVFFPQHHTCASHISLLETRKILNLDDFQHCAQLVSTLLQSSLNVFFIIGLLITWHRRQNKYISFQSSVSSMRTQTLSFSYTFFSSPEQCLPYSGCSINMCEWIDCPRHLSTSSPHTLSGILGRTADGNNKICCLPLPPFFQD